VGLSFLIVNLGVPWTFPTKLASALAELSKKANRNATNWCHYRSGFSFNGGESEATQNFSCLYLTAYHNFWRRKLAQKIGRLDRTESRMLKTETE